MDVRKIVVAYDGSQGSRQALQWAMTLAGKFGAEITTVTVVKPPEFSPTISEIDEYFDHAQKHYQPLFEKVRWYGQQHGLTIKTELLKGHPAESIVKYAYDQKADLIITGTRGMGGFKTLVIGSVAQKVASYSKVPVLIVKESDLGG